MTQEERDAQVAAEKRIVLRDMFACAALTGLLAKGYDFDTEHAVNVVYTIADAMLAERAK